MIKIIHTAISSVSETNFVAPLVEADQVLLDADSEIWGTDNRLIYNTENTAQCIKISKHECNLSLNLFQNFFRLISLITSFKRNKPDVLVAHFSRGAFLPLLAGWLLNIKYRIYFNHGLPYLGYNGVVRFFLKALDHFNCIFAHEIVTVNKSIARFIENDLTSNKKIHVLGAGSCCGLSPDHFQELTKDQKKNYKEKLGIGQKSIIIIYVGRPVERKGYLVAYDAFCKLKEMAPQLDLTLFMAGIFPEDLLSSRKSIIDGAIALGFRDDIKQLYGIADAVFLPSFHEGMPYCLLEGGAQKCALVASRLPGLDELIIDGETGYLIDPNNLDSTTQTLYKMVSDPGKLSKMGDNSFDKMKNFKRNKIVKEYKEIISMRKEEL